MKEENGRAIDYGSLGIIAGVMVVVLAILWVLKMTLSRDDEKAGEAVTWVG